MRGILYPEKRIFPGEFFGEAKKEGAFLQEKKAPYETILNKHKEGFSWQNIGFLTKVHPR